MIRKDSLTQDAFVRSVYPKPNRTCIPVQRATLLRHEVHYYRTVGGCTFPGVHVVSGE